MVMAEQAELLDFFSHFVARSKVNEAVNALLAARELSFVPVGNGSKIQVAPPRTIGRVHDIRVPTNRRRPPP
jgi:hypothetical protein